MAKDEVVEKLRQIITMYRNLGYFVSPECKRCEFLSSESREEIWKAIIKVQPEAIGLMISMNSVDHLAPVGEWKTLVIVEGNPV